MTLTSKRFDVSAYQVGLAFHDMLQVTEPETKLDDLALMLSLSVLASERRRILDLRLQASMHVQGLEAQYHRDAIQVSLGLITPTAANKHGRCYPTRALWNESIMKEDYQVSKSKGHHANAHPPSTTFSYGSIYS